MSTLPLRRLNIHDYLILFGGVRIVCAIAVKEKETPPLSFGTLSDPQVQTARLIGDPYRLLPIEIAYVTVYPSCTDGNRFPDSAISAT
jgi:hypothetical protein